MSIKTITDSEKSQIQAMMQKPAHLRENVSAQKIRNEASGEIDPQLLLKIVKRALKNLEKTATPKNV